MEKFKHYIFTRFHYPEDYSYLEERFRIFHNFTKPSFESQTNTNFIWVIHTNSNHKKLFQPFKNIEVKLVSEKNKWGGWEKISHSTPTNYTLTSRIDCDDAIHPEYVKTIQELFTQDQSTRIIDGPGYRYINKTGEVYTYDKYTETKCSPFSTLVSPFKDKLTVFCQKHGQLSKQFPVQFHDKRLWIQHIHNSNKLMKGVGNKKVDLDLNIFNINL